MMLLQALRCWLHRPPDIAAKPTIELARAVLDRRNAKQEHEKAVAEIVGKPTMMPQTDVFGELVSDMRHGRLKLQQGRG